jgi:hypothetical protein
MFLHAFQFSYSFRALRILFDTDFRAGISTVQKEFDILVKALAGFWGGNSNNENSFWPTLLHLRTFLPCPEGFQGKDLWPIAD